MTPATIEAAIQAPNHPALRWTPLTGDPAQHRRVRDTDTTICGLAGPLFLADTDAPRCEDGCWG